MAPANSLRWIRSARTTGGCASAIPDELDPYLVYKGSIAIDGISLTIAAIDGGVLSATIIPHTFRNTTLGGYRPGARVNLECDILAKHVEKLLRRLDLQRKIDGGETSGTGLLKRDRPGGPSYVFNSATISAAISRACSSSPGDRLIAPTRACPPPP